MATGREYCCVVVGDDDRARFEDRRVEMDAELSAPPAEPLSYASLTAVFGPPAEVMLIEGDSDWAGDAPHPAPARLLWAILVGEWQVTTAGGDTRTFAPGDLVLFEDTRGAGHSSRILSADALAMVLRFA